MNNFISNLNVMEQVGPSEMNHIFTRSQKLNSEAVVDFVKALCKVSMEELRSASDPRIFSLTKIVEIAHYNMNRIRLVWSSIWHVLSNFFVTIGCSENLSIAIFAMDSLRQISMKFLEREELANYNFQNDFLKPFVTVMCKSRPVEIRELIIRCVSQMVLTRVNHVKSGWKSMFMVFSTASYQQQQQQQQQSLFPLGGVGYMNPSFPIRSMFCAVKLAEGEVGSIKHKDKSTFRKTSHSPCSEIDGKLECLPFSNKDDHVYFWFPLQVGLSELTSDLRPEIKKSALQVLFETLRTYGHLFSLPLWERVFDSVLFPIFYYVRHAIDPSGGSQGQGLENDVKEDQDVWLYETCTLALQLVVDLFVNLYDTVNPLLKKVLMLLTSFTKRPHQSLAGIGIAAFVRLMSYSGSLLSDDKWLEVVLSLKEAATATLPNFSDIGESTRHTVVTNDDPESKRSRMLYFAVANAKCRAAIQLLLIQAVMEIYNTYRQQLSKSNTVVLFNAVHSVASHAYKINSDNKLRSTLQELGSVTQMQDPRY